MTDHTPAAQAAMQEAVRNAIRKAYDDGYNDAKTAPDNCSTYCAQRAEREGSAALLSKLRAPVAKPKRAPADDWRVTAIAECLEAEWDEMSPDLAEANARIIVGYLIDYEKESALIEAKQASAPVAGEATTCLGDNVAERLESMADDQPPGSQAQSDLYTAATIWRKHISHHAAPQASEAVRKPAMTVAEFCAEAGRLGLTADTLAAQLAERPEFADCLPHMEETQTAVASALHLLRKYAPQHHWTPHIEAALLRIKDGRLRRTEEVSPALLASSHTGMRVDYRGLLRQARETLGAGSALAEMLRQLQEHLLELGQRWYSGDTAVVDELLQLYCVEPAARAALATRLDQHKAGVSDA